MIVIVGAGLTGLALAHELDRRGAEFLVLEAARRPGGVIRSDRIEGRVVEWGPQRARLTGSLGSLVAELGIEDRIVRAPPGLPLLVYARGALRPVPFSPREFLRTDLLTAAGKLRLLLEPLTRAPRPHERVGRLLRRKLGTRAYLDLAGPLYGGLYASDPDEMTVGTSLAHVLRELGIGRSLLLPLVRRGGTMSPREAVSFRDGLQTLPDALYARHAARIRLDSPVGRIGRADGGTAHRFMVRAGREEIHATDVVLGVPASAAASILAEAAPDAAGRIARLRYNRLAVVHLLSDLGLRAVGYQVGLGEALRTRGVTANHALFGREGLYTVFLGGARAPDLVDRPDDEITRIAIAEFSHVTGGMARAISVHRESMPAWDRSWEALEGVKLPAGLHLAANWQSRPGIPGRLSQARQLAHALTR